MWTSPSKCSHSEKQEPLPLSKAQTWLRKWSHQCPESNHLKESTRLTPLTKSPRERQYMLIFICWWIRFFHGCTLPKATESPENKVMFQHTKGLWSDRGWSWQQSSREIWYLETRGCTAAGHATGLLLYFLGSFFFLKIHQVFTSTKGKRWNSTDTT